MVKDAPYGKKTEMFQGIELECNYYIPNHTLHDLMMIFEKAHKEGNPLAGNPSLWPNTKGIKAIVETVKKVYGIEI